MQKWTWIVLVMAVAVLGLAYSVLQQRRATFNDTASEIGVEEYDTTDPEDVPAGAETDAPADEPAAGDALQPADNSP